MGALAYGVDGDIYVADWDGANPVRIANGRPADDCGQAEHRAEYTFFGSAWSPDGRYLAYRHTNCQAPRDAWRTVIISDPEGNHVASFPGEGWRIPWSPDSTRVATWVRWGKTIGVYGLDGVRQKVLTLPRRLMGDHDPVWSPEGESLLVPHSVGGNTHVVEVPLDGTPPRQLPLPRSGWVTYSPDGSRVVYHAYGLIAAADGSHPQEELQSGTVISRPVWSPAGDRIAFSSVYGTELRILDVATGTVRLLAKKDGSEILRAIDFSPEGDRILFLRTEELSGDPPPDIADQVRNDRVEGVSSLWSIHADGSNLRRLVAGTGWGDWQSLGPTR